MLAIDTSRQFAFAELSGDHNPLHVDADQARRSQFGGCVVHGVHLVLAALDSLDLRSPSTIIKLDAQFRSAVMVGEVVSFTHESLKDGRMRVAVRVGDQVRTTVLVELEQIPSVGSVPHQSQWPKEVSVRLNLDDLIGFEGADPIALDDEAFSVLFPSLAGSLSRPDAATLLGTTRIVGMRCPGQWALFRRLLWQCASVADVSVARSEVIRHRVSEIDKRFSMVTLALEVGCRAIQAEVIVREPPPAQIDFSVVCSRVGSNEFEGVRGLIVGGSRGLGELAAKVLVAGGAEVLITYQTGADDAVRVAANLGHRAHTVQFSADAPDPATLNRITAFAPTHISYFATPIITRRPPGSWDPVTFARFIDVCVIGLSKLLAIVHGGGTLESVFFPSSTFVDETPAGFAEYIAAKIAGEAMCTSWQRVHPAQRVVVERLPPLVTDQTAARLGTDTTGNLEVLLPALRRIVE